MHLSTLPNAELPPSVPIQPVFCARADGVLLYSRLPDRAVLARLAPPLTALASRPGFAAGAKAHADEQSALLLIWCEQPDVPAVAATLGSRDLGVWPGHIHAVGEWIAVCGMPHLSLVGSTPTQVPEWLSSLWLGQAVPA